MREPPIVRGGQGRSAESVESTAINAAYLVIFCLAVLLFIYTVIV